MTFDEYVKEINKLAQNDGMIDTNQQYCDPETWRDHYNDGVTTPEEAWNTEKSYFEY